MWRVRFSFRVERDVADAATWYESRRQGLGPEFVEAVARVWHELAENPLLMERKHPIKICVGGTPSVSRTGLFTKSMSEQARCLSSL